APALRRIQAFKYTARPASCSLAPKRAEKAPNTRLVSLDTHFEGVVMPPGNFKEGFRLRSARKQPPALSQRNRHVVATMDHQQRHAKGFHTPFGIGSGFGGAADPQR